MKNILAIGMLSILAACNSNNTNSDKQLATEITCENIGISDFETFLTITPATAEKELKKILGKSTGGSYSDDKSTFIYEFEGTKRVPVKVYVNAESGVIETVFMEILGLNGNFDRDVKKAKADFPISKCHLLLFGKQPKELIELFGQAYEDNFKKDNVEADVRVLRYFTDDEKTAVTLNFYPSQNYRLSSIVVDWF